MHTSHIFAAGEFVMNTFKDVHAFAVSRQYLCHLLAFPWVNSTECQCLSRVVSGFPEPSRCRHLIYLLSLCVVSLSSFRSSVWGRKAWSASCPSSSAWWSGAKTCMWIPTTRPASVRDPCCKQPPHPALTPTTHNRLLTSSGEAILI